MREPRFEWSARIFSRIFSPDSVYRNAIEVPSATSRQSSSQGRIMVVMLYHSANVGDICYSYSFLVSLQIIIFLSSQNAHAIQSQAPIQASACNCASKSVRITVVVCFWERATPNEEPLRYKLSRINVADEHCLVGRRQQRWRRLGAQRVGRRHDQYKCAWT